MASEDYLKKYQFDYNGAWLKSDTVSDLTEAVEYIKYGHQKYGKYLVGVYAEIDGDDVVLEFAHKPLPGFERIRRITGYLVGTLDRFNDAKAAEERARVKHGVS